MIESQMHRQMGTHTHKPLEKYKQGRGEKQMKGNICEHAPRSCGLLPRCHVIFLWPCLHPCCVQMLRTQNPAARKEEAIKTGTLFNFHIPNNTENKLKYHMRIFNIDRYVNRS